LLAKRIVVLLVALFAMSAWWLDSANASDCAPGPNTDLSNCDFSFADLANADLQGSNLTNADFASADLTNANLAGANVAGAKLATASIANIASGELTGTPASLPTGWKLVSGYIAGPTANLTNAALTGANLAGMNLSGATLVGVKSGGVVGSPTLPNLWSTYSGYLIGPMADLSGARIRVLVPGLNFVGANLSGADLSGSSLVSQDFSGASLEGANLSLSSLSNAKFTNTNLKNANLNGFITSGSINFIDAANLDGLRTGGIRFGGIANKGSIGVPNGFVVDNGHIIGPRVNLTDANLSGVNLTFIDLTGANLTNVSSGSHSNTVPMGLPDGWQFLSGYIVGPTANLTGAALSGSFAGASLEFANLTNAMILNADLSGVDMSHATLKGLKSRVNIAGPSALPDPWVYRDGFFLGPEASFSDTYVGGDFSGANLSGATFTRVNFGGDCTGTNFAGAKFTGGSIGGSFSSADFTGAQFESVRLLGDLSLANFSGVKSSGLWGTPTLSPDWQLLSGYLVGPGANLARANLVNTNLAGTNLDNADLTLASLEGVKSGSIVGVPKVLPPYWTLQNGYLIGHSADLTNADLTGTNLEFLSNALQTVKFTGANFTNARIGKADLRNLDLRSNIFKNAYFGGTLCMYCNLAGVDLSGADLTGAQLFEANLSGANLSFSNFSNANLTNAEMASADLDGSSLASANLSGVSSGNILGVPTSLPSGWKLSNGFLIGSGADLTSANLGQANLSGMTLSSANLTGALMAGTDLTNVKMTSVVGVPLELPTGWKVSKGILLGPDANLSGLNLAAVSLSSVSLAGADLQGVSSSSIVGSPSALPSGWKMFKGQLIGAGANLTDAILTGMNLDGVSLGETTLVRVTSGGITGTPSALPDKWKLIGGYLIGREANLKNANLANQNLAGVTLSFADMTGANLTNVSSGGIDGIASELPAFWTVVSGYLFGPGANLQGADLSNAELFDLNINGVDLSGTSLLQLKSARLTGTPSGLPAGWRVLGGYLLGPTADLESAEMAGLDLSGQNLAGANLKWARLQLTNLSGANLEGADLTNAFLAGANLVSVNLEGAILKDADLSGVTSGQLTGTPSSLPTNWFMVSGALLQKMPSISLPTLGRAVVGKTLTPQLGTIPAGATATYSWLDGGTAIPGATGASLLISAPLAGRDIAVRVTVSKAGFEEVVLTSLTTKVVLGTLDIRTPSLLGNPLVGSTLSTESLTLDPETQVAIQWLENGTPKAGSTSTKLVLSSTIMSKMISVRYTFTKAGFETLTLTTPEVKVGLGVLTAVTPKITGTAKVAKTLTAVSAKWASVATIQYQWLLDGKAIKAATKSTYKLLPTQKGRKISVQVTQIAAGYKSAVKISTALKVG
jgi:uncharacterized protein YjbI with pentapeptide repeats